MDESVTVLHQHERRPGSARLMPRMSPRDPRGDPWARFQRRLRAINGTTKPMATIAPAITPRRSDSRLLLSVMAKPRLRISFGEPYYLARWDQQPCPQCFSDGVQKDTNLPHVDFSGNGGDD
jgi:hypothetical protein